MQRCLDASRAAAPGLRCVLQAEETRGAKSKSLPTSSKQAQQINKMGAGASVEGDAKPKFIYLPVVGRGEQIRLLAAEHGLDYETVLPAGFGGE